MSNREGPARIPAADPRYYLSVTLFLTGETTTAPTKAAASTAGEPAAEATAAREVTTRSRQGGLRRGHSVS